MDKKQVSAILEEMGTILELQGANPFKSRAFHTAARAVEGITQDLRAAVDAGTLRNVKGIGESIGKIITDLVTSGASQEYRDLQASVPEGLLHMLRIQGLGPKKVKALFDRLHISTIEALEKAAGEGRIAGLEGFGKKTEENILVGIRALRQRADRVLYPQASAVAERLLGDLHARPGVIRASIAGSLRRCRETIGDVDLLVSASPRSRNALMEYFVRHPEVESVLAQGDTKSSVVLRGGIHCDLRIVEDKEFSFALNYFTGNKEHNVEMRSRARKLGLSLNEYGFTPVPGERKRKLPAACKEESDIYRAVGLPYIPPELREFAGEFEAAEEGNIPRLLEASQIRGTLHCHTTYSDGVNSLEEMVDAARTLGWEYLGIADHSKVAAYAGGLSVDRVKEQIRHIESLNGKLKSFHIFAGTECDILPNGELDWPDRVLALFDYVVIAIHSNFKMTEAEMTKRITRALRNKYVTFLAHPTGRLLLSRDGYPVDMTRVIDVAADHGKTIEINAHPMRCDLDWRLCRYAKDRGLRIPINPDAHSIDGLRDVYQGVGIARKGWLTAGDVVNAWPVKDVDRFFRGGRS